MNADTCKDFIKALELYHDKKFSSVARDTYWAGLKDYDDEKIVLLLQVTYGKFPPGRVPSIDDLKALLREIRDVAQGKEKGAEMANRHPLWRSAESSRPMIEESFAMLSRLLEDRDRLAGRQCVDQSHRERCAACGKPGAVAGGAGLEQDSRRRRQVVIAVAAL